MVRSFSYEVEVEGVSPPAPVLMPRRTAAGTQLPERGSGIHDTIWELREQPKRLVVRGPTVRAQGVSPFAQGDD
ncbi:hypothetical protein [Candidatus Reidiella endopervernicosa]|uniref:Uncharacterized protein n=1 Tax=Candidatus Reidiella endopervernicosa TaxID=2738883 RepID=A0A6N0HZL7_9GAMM|nr:hypothetical protein [Candidatus Reidiella endopervernicosa]QKQ27798.1 hypothetical protein HUE57_17055 [Candidatus Reidiella endopervernicosa]